MGLNGLHILKGGANGGHKARSPAGTRARQSPAFGRVTA